LSRSPHANGPERTRAGERRSEHGAAAEAVPGRDRPIEAELVAQRQQVLGVYVYRASFPRARVGAGAAAGEVEADEGEPIEVEAIDEGCQPDASCWKPWAKTMGIGPDPSHHTESSSPRTASRCIAAR
jgi:hypothetical protein